MTGGLPNPSLAPHDRGSVDSVVYLQTHDVVGEARFGNVELARRNAGGSTAGPERSGLEGETGGPQPGVEIFAGHAPALSQSPFEAGTDGPTHGRGPPTSVGGFGEQRETGGEALARRSPGKPAGHMS